MCTVHHPRSVCGSSREPVPLVGCQDFDSSVKRGRPFQFEIGIGQVIRGWDVGMASMKRGEKAVLTIAPDYGYGARGAGGVIPGTLRVHYRYWQRSRARTSDFVVRV